MKRTPTEKLEKLRELAEEGLPDVVIASRLGMSQVAVKRWRYELRLVGPSGLNRRWQLIPAEGV